MQSVVHTHQPLATLLGIVEMPILPLLHVESLVVERQPIPIFACAELIVSRGLGATGVPLRLACPPEAVLVRLHTACTGGRQVEGGPEAATATPCGRSPSSLFLS